MNVINENYHTNYKLKLDIDNYCYYTDETNRNIMIELITDYRKNVLGEGDRDCHTALARFKQRLNTGPVFVFFDRYRITYDNLSAYCNIENTFAAEMEYNVVKLSNRTLIIIE